MAARTQGSVTAYAISLALFVILFLFSFVLAIIFKTQVQSAQIQALESKQALVEVIKTNELSRPDILELKVKQASTGMSIVGQLIATNTRLKQLINASPRSSLDAIKTDIESAGSS